MDAILQRFAKRALWFGACAALCAVAYSFWHRWGALTGAAEWKEAFGYYALPLITIAAVFVLAAIWPGVDRFFVFVIAVSIYIALFITDIYFTYEYRDTIGATRAAAERLHFPYDSRDLQQVVSDLRKKGVRADPFAVIHYDPNLITLGTMPNTTVVACNEFGPWFTPSSDRYGFINPDGIWDQTEPLDAVIVGDSYAMGQCDPTTGGFAGLLRQQGLRILNLGIGGNDPLLDLASLAEFGSMRKSHFVFWMHYAGNDLSGLSQNRKLPILMRYLNEPSFRQHLSDRMPEIEAHLKAIEPQVYGPPDNFLRFMFTDPKGLLRNLRLYSLRATFGLARSDARFDFDLFERVLKRARNVADGMDSKLVIVNIPTAGQIAHASIVDDRTADAIKNAGVQFVDLKLPFLAAGDYKTMYSQRDKGHFSPAGNKLVAKILWDIVAKTKKQ